METSDLKNAGLKVTLPRMKILELLERSDPHHKSAEDIYRDLMEAGEEIGLATVYRVLTQFETAGLVNRQIHPEMRFTRNYKKLRPHTPYCEEMIILDA